MSRFAAADTVDDPQLVDGDDAFEGVNQLHAPGQLKPGEVTDAKNCRFTNHKVEPRQGVAKLPWTNRVSTSVNLVQPFGVIYGAGVFRDVDGLEWLIIAADGRVFRTRENNGALEVPLLVTENITYPVTFTATVNGMVMFRGTANPELIMQTLDIGFAPMTTLITDVVGGAGTENVAAGLVVIPNASSGEWIGNRLFIPYETATEKDLITISDYLNATRYAAQRSQARINQGSADRLVRFFKFNEQAGIAFKSQSIYVLTGLQFDLAAMRLDELTHSYGLAGAKAVVNVGADVWFLAPMRGICSVTLTDQNKLQGVDVPVSAMIQRIINRIDWNNASGATFAYWDNKFFAAVPLDESKGYGPEIIAPGTVYDGTGTNNQYVLPGQTYVWTPGSSASSIQPNPGPGGILTDAGDFVASTMAMQLSGTPGAAVTDSLKRVYPRVNNAVIVYDFLRQKWAGYDSGTAIMVKEWFTMTRQGQHRLFFLSADGFINLYEELAYDEVATETLPFLSVFVPVSFGMANNDSFTVIAGEEYAFFSPAANGTVQILNGGVTITATGIGNYTAGLFQAESTTITLTVAAGGLGFRFYMGQVAYGVSTEYIDCDWTSRGYRCEDGGRKKFQRVKGEVDSWFPTFAISALSEGVKEEFTLQSNITRSRTKYSRPWDATDWNETNYNSDHATRYRQDYSALLGETTTASGAVAAGVRYFVEDLTGAAQITYNAVNVDAPSTFVGVTGVTTYTVNSGTPKVYAPGNYIFMGSNGVDPDVEQTTTEGYRIPAPVRGRECQIRVRSTQGRCSVRSLSVQAQPVDRREGTFS